MYKRQGLHLGDAHLHGRQGVGHAQTAGIVEVDHQVQIGIGLLHGADHRTHLGRIGDADGIAQAAGLHAGVHIVLQEVDRRGDVYKRQSLTVGTLVAITIY